MRAPTSSSARARSSAARRRPPSSRALGRPRARAAAATSASPSRSQAVVDRTVAELGRVDILVNNAGTSWGASPEDVPLEGWQKVIDVNLTGAFLFAQAAGRVLIQQGEGGKIVNVASVAAFRGAPQEAMNAIPYNASKGGARRAHDRPGREVGAARHQRERDRARLVPVRHVRRLLEARRRRLPAAHPARPLRRPGRPQGRGRLPRLRRLRLRHRRRRSSVDGGQLAG